MGLGITNASTGGGGSTFSATLQIATDPNAVITAVNLAGDTFNGTADSSGSLILTITEPGTYTVTETDGGVESIIIADNGATYTLTITAFDGNMIVGGIVVVENGFYTEGYSYSTYTATAPTITNNIPDSRIGNSIRVTLNGGLSGIYVMTDLVSISSFSDLSYVAYTDTSTGKYSKAIAIDENDNLTELGSLPPYYQATGTFALSNLDSSKKYRFGVWSYGQYATSTMINKYVLQ